MGSGQGQMIALDTNLVIRYAIKDEPDQARLAGEFLRANRCLLLPTVVLEAVWVLGSKRGYALEPTVVAERIRHVAGLPSVQVEHGGQVAEALNWYEQGMDFADALHLALAGPEIGLATLDQGIQKRAKQLGLTHRVTLIESAA